MLANSHRMTHRSLPRVWRNAVIVTAGALMSSTVLGLGCVTADSGEATESFDAGSSSAAQLTGSGSGAGSATGGQTDGMGATSSPGSSGVADSTSSGPDALPETSGDTTGTEAQGVCDDFERVRLGADWDVVFPQGGDQVRIIDESDLGLGPGPQGFFIVRWQAETFSDDQFAEAEIPLDPTPGWVNQVFVRWGPDLARYAFHYNADPGQKGFGNWEFKFDGVAGPQTRIIASALADVTPGPGDILRVEVEGSTLRGYLNGELMLEAADDALTSGSPGMAARWATGNMANQISARVWESWCGGSLND